MKCLKTKNKQKKTEIGLFLKQNREKSPLNKLNTYLLGQAIY
jgi:hypothetical protein